MLAQPLITSWLKNNRIEIKPIFCAACYLQRIAVVIWVALDLIITGEHPTEDYRRYNSNNLEGRFNRGSDLEDYDPIESVHFILSEIAFPRSDERWWSR